MNQPYRPQTVLHFDVDRHPYTVAQWTDDVLVVNCVMMGVRPRDRFYGRMTMVDGAWRFDPDARAFIDLRARSYPSWKGRIEAIESFIRANPPTFEQSPLGEWANSPAHAGHAAMTGPLTQPAQPALGAVRVGRFCWRCNVALDQHDETWWQDVPVATERHGVVHADLCDLCHKLWLESVRASCDSQDERTNP